MESLRKRGSESLDAMFLYSAHSNPARDIRQDYERWLVYATLVPDNSIPISVVTTSHTCQQFQYFQLIERPRYRIGINDVVDLEGTLGGKLTISAVHGLNPETAFVLLRAIITVLPDIQEYMVVSKLDCVPYQSYEFNGTRPLRFPRIAYLSVPIVYFRFPQTEQSLDIQKKCPMIQDASNIPDSTVMNPSARAASRREKHVRHHRRYIAPHPYGPLVPTSHSYDRRPSTSTHNPIIPYEHRQLILDLGSPWTPPIAIASSSTRSVAPRSSVASSHASSHDSVLTEEIYEEK